MLKVMYVNRAGLQQRFRSRNRCFAILENGNILSFVWIRFGSRYSSELHLKFNLKSNQGWFYNAVTVKAARGRGYFANICRHVVKVLAAEGFDDFFIDVEQRNRPSIRAIEKSGYKRLVKVRMSKLLSKVSYEITVYDKNGWRQLSEMIENFHLARNVTYNYAAS
jgi:RimJ/RimL family protein N-acetyltransferase